MVLTDEELIERYQSTNDAAHARAKADELLRRYSARTVSWCWRFSEDRETAMDLAQEVLLKAYRRLTHFRSDAKFSTWLYAIARNHCLNFLRDRASQPAHVAEPFEDDLLDERESGVLAELVRQEDLGQLRTIMAQTLDETEAKVMMLHYGEEIPLADITQLLGLDNKSGAKAYIVSAKRKLNLAIHRRRPGSPGATRQSGADEEKGV
jgi:RNA polymerase sigma-70 factor (ECF subfamily)